MDTTLAGGHNGRSRFAGGGELCIPQPKTRFAKFIVTRTIMNMCLAGGAETGEMISKRWLEQDRVDVEGRRAADQEAEQTEEEDDTDKTETY